MLTLDELAVESFTTTAHAAGPALPGDEEWLRARCTAPLSNCPAYGDSIDNC